MRSILVFAVSLSAQAATLAVSANKTVFVWGESVKVSATLIDDAGVAGPAANVVWTVDVPANASVASDGTVTPRAMQTFVVTAAASGLTAQIRLQPLPLEIDVLPEKTTMAIGSTQQLRATVLDVNGKPIPNIPVSWAVSDDGANSSPAARIASNGVMTAIQMARVRALARISYSSVLPGFLPQAQGEAAIDIQPPLTYKMEKIWTSTPSGAATSRLAPLSSPLIPTPSGGFLFAASLDGVGGALLDWENGQVTPILASGAPDAETRIPLSDFINYTSSTKGELLVQQSDLVGHVQISRGPSDLLTPLITSGSNLFGASSVYQWTISRNSLASSGAMVVSVAYTDAATNRGAYGVYRGYNRGYSEPLLTSLDSRIQPDLVPTYIGAFGIAGDGTAWFYGTGTNPQTNLWRSRPGEDPEKIFGIGDTFNGETIQGLGTGASNLFVAENGDVLIAIATDKGVKYVLYHAGNVTSPDVLSTPANGIFWYDPTFGALLDTTVANRRGLYVWNKDGLRLVLALNDTSIDGSPVQSIDSAIIATDGSVYANLRTASSQMTIARLLPTQAILLRAGDSVPVSVPPLISWLIPGSGTGMPPIIAGGVTGSIAQLDDAGNVSAIVPLGAPLPDKKSFIGTTRYIAGAIPDGRIVFAQNRPAADSGIYTWNNGTIEMTVPAPIVVPGIPNSSSPSQIAVNRKGNFTFATNYANNAIFLFKDGQLINVSPSPYIPIDGIGLIAYNVAIDASDRVMFSGTITTDRSGPYFALYDGTSSHIVLKLNDPLPDSRFVPSGSSVVMNACANGFIVPMLGSFLRYSDSPWQYVANRNDVTATGFAANTLNPYYFSVNQSCDVAYVSAIQFGTSLEVHAASSSAFDEIQVLSEPTAEGEVLTLIQYIIDDSATVYLLATNDSGQEVIYRATPLQ